MVPSFPHRRRKLVSPAQHEERRQSFLRRMQQDRAYVPTCTMAQAYPPKREPNEGPTAQAAARALSPPKSNRDGTVNAARLESLLKISCTRDRKFVQQFSK